MDAEIPRSRQARAAAEAALVRVVHHYGTPPEFVVLGGLVPHEGPAAKALTRFPLSSPATCGRPIPPDNAHSDLYEPPVRIVRQNRRVGDQFLRPKSGEHGS